jgi:hypothetical protein
MTKICRAEAVLESGAECSVEMLAAAKVAGVLAAKKTPELIPFSPPVRSVKTEIEIAEGESTLRLIAAVEADAGGEACALTAAAVAALTLCEMAKTSILSIRLIERTENAPTPFPRKKAAPSRVRAKPAALVGDVTAKVPASAGESGREAFRTFMTAKRLRATEWARAAGVPASLIYAYLAGRTAQIPAAAAAKLAKAARVRVEDMFKG